MEEKQISLRINNLAVILNPAAGAGRESVEIAASLAIGIFKESHIIRSPVGKDRNETMEIAAELSSTVDAIIVIGGDGTMSDVAYSLFRNGTNTPILGIGAGSTNAGPLITINARKLENLDPHKLTVKNVGGILAALNDKQMGLGFNDIVLGNTVLTTLEGRVVQVSAAYFMDGKKITASPTKVGTTDSEVHMIRPGEVKLIHKGEFGQIFAAPLEERYLGKGLAGGTSLATALGLPAGIAITNVPLINYSIGPQELLKMEPIVTSTASFREGDEVVVKGLKDGTCLNIDGNPIAILKSCDRIRLRYIHSAANVLKML